MRCNRLATAHRSLLLLHLEGGPHTETSKVVGFPVVHGVGGSRCASSSTSSSALVKYFLKHFIMLFFLGCFLGCFLEYFYKCFLEFFHSGTSPGASNFEFNGGCWCAAEQDWLRALQVELE